ncbi:heavy-metal-associated domain-containing protein [Halalkalibacterium halodurans]|uniref:HMA domain-containing protein n=1 Tax=Cytobacillus horneckiae TaxID=549687 RepID=A0A2N0ZAM0_9BACI|nr:hypothetical protein CWS20_23295 [Cytobacillus horneckiae]TES50334.1 heavy-metal-associated domain-containing protein [Halalkalibacterium halodurans]
MKKVLGVSQFNVNVKNQSATVIFDPSKTDLNSLREAIHRAGYTPKYEIVKDG